MGVSKMHIPNMRIYVSAPRGGGGGGAGHGVISHPMKELISM